MFNNFTDDSYPDNYLLQDKYDVSDEPDSSENLDTKVHEVAKNLKRRAAFKSCITSIEVEEDYTLFNGIWNKVQGIARKRWFREAAIIAVILLFKTGLFMSYREAHKANLKIPDL